MGHILNFARRESSGREAEAADWRNEELAELYRVENSLLQAGVSVTTARGVTDEGDPWFVFCGANEDVIVHIARFDGGYHIYAKALDQGLQGQSFTEITKKFIARLPMQMSSGVTLHPSALFGLMVATLFFAVDHKPAAAAEKAPAHPTPPASLVNTLRHYVRALADAGEEKAFASEHELDALTQLVAVAATLAAAAPAAIAPAETPAAASSDAPPAPQSGQTLASAASFEERHAGDGAPTTFSSAPAPAPTSGAQTANAPALATLANATPAPISNVSAPRSANHADAAAPAPVVSAGPGVFVHPDSDGGIVLQGSGALSLTEAAGAVFRIEVAKDAHVSLDLGLTYAKGATSADATVVLGGHATLDLTDLTALATGASLAAPVNAFGPSTSSAAPASPPQLELSLASAGAEANTLTLGGNVGASVNLTIHVTGAQNLQLNESASNLSGVSVNSTQFEGALTIGVDLSDVNGGPTLIGQSSFVVGENSSLALLNVHDNATVQIGIDLASAIVDMDAGADTLDLQLTGAAGGVSVTSFSASAVSDLSIESLGGAQKANTLEAVYSNALDKIAISGDAPLTIDAFVVSSTALAQAVTVDASGFGANLHIDVTGLAASLAAGVGLTVKLGAAGSVIADLNTSAPLTVVSAGGGDVVNLGAGATQVSLVNPGAAMQVNVGAGAVADHAVDATHATGAAQAALDAMSLVAAAEAAAAAAAPSAPHQAVLFNYQGGAYVFVDALGDHQFNAAADAIVGLVGAAAPAEMAAQFHST